jgi:hypothetical protein
MAFDDIDAPAFAFVMYGYARGWCSRYLGTAGARRQDWFRRGTGGWFIPRFATDHALHAE